MWAVVLDADETVLDNAEYQRRRARVDNGHTSATRAVRERVPRCSAIPQFPPPLHGGRTPFTRA